MAGTLVVHVSDPQDRPVRGLQIGLKSGGGTATTLDDGSARIPLAQGTNEHSFVSVQIVSSPRGADSVILSPYDFRVEVPSFENKPENYVSVTVVQRSDRTALAGGQSHRRDREAGQQGQHAAVDGTGCGAGRLQGEPGSGCQTLWLQRGRSGEGDTELEAGSQRSSPIGATGFV